LQKQGPVSFTITYTNLIGNQFFTGNTLALANIQQVTLSGNAAGTGTPTLVTIQNSPNLPNIYTYTIPGLTGAGTLGIAVPVNTASDSLATGGQPPTPTAPSWRSRW